MNWMVYFVGGSRDLQKHAMERPRVIFECPVLERMPTMPSDAMVEEAHSCIRERYRFRPIGEGLGVYVLEETR